MLLLSGSWGVTCMLRLVFWTLVGFGATLYVFGNDLDADEQARVDQLRADRTPIIATLTQAFRTDSKRRGDYVAPLSEADYAAATGADIAPTLTGEETLPTQGQAVLLTNYTPPSLLEAQAKAAAVRVAHADTAEGAGLATDANNTTTSATTLASDPARLAAIIDAENAAAQSEAMILRVVTGKRVNVRSGPSTANEVLGQVVEADIVQVVSNPYSEWVKIVVEGGGVEGYMSARFLTELGQ